MGVERLFVYGSLQPGGPNENVLAGVDGEWEPAIVRGELVESGWGAALGYPALILDERGDDIEGYVLSSADLGAMWTHLDAFEGEGYERVAANVTLRSGESVRAQVYVLRA